MANRSCGKSNGKGSGGLGLKGQSNENFGFQQSQSPRSLLTHDPGESTAIYFAQAFKGTVSHKNVDTYSTKKC